MSRRHSLFLAALALLLLPTAYAQVLCFSSAGPAKGIRLQLTLPRDGSQIASLRYQRGSKDILLTRVNESAAGGGGNGPATVKTTFFELMDGRRTGQYILTTRGGAVGDLVYQRQTDRKIYTFYDDQEASVGDACEWHSKE